MTLIYLNARSVKSVTRGHNKLVELNNLVSLNSPTIVAIPETWLTADICDNEVLPSNYIVHSSDRSQSCYVRSAG